MILLGDIEIVLPERPRRVVHRGSAEAFDHADRTAPSGGNSGPRTVLVLGAVPLNHRLCNSLPSRSRIRSKHAAAGSGVALLHDENHLRSLRAALHHHLQIARQSQMRAIRITAHFRLNQRAPHHRGDPIDQRMMNAAVRYVDHAVAVEFEQAHFGRAHVPADGQTRAQPKAAASFPRRPAPRANRERAPIPPARRVRRVLCHDSANLGHPGQGGRWGQATSSWLTDAKLAALRTLRQC
jgi:hypothetical protein